MPVLDKIHRHLTVNKPEHADEKGDVNDNNYQSESFQHIIDYHQVFNLIMIFIHIVSQGLVVPNLILHSALRKRLNSYEHLSNVEKFKAI